MCVKNGDYPVSLELHKVYRAIPDPGAEARQYVRIVDESGEDYLFPASYFVAIELPKSAARAFVKAS